MLSPLEDYLLSVLLIFLYSVMIFGQHTMKQIVCENNKTEIQCSNGEVIHCLSALYGRTSRLVCNHTSIFRTDCCSPMSLKVVQTKCEGKPTCTLEASNGYFGDPCQGTYKYLEVEIQCVQDLDPWDQTPSSPSCLKIISASTTTNFASSTIKSNFESTTAGTSTVTLELSTQNSLNKPSASKEKGLIIGAVSGSLISFIIICLLGFIIRSRFMRKAKKAGNGNIYTDLDKKDEIKNHSTKDNTGGSGYTQDYTTLNQITTKPATNEHDAPYVVLDPSETGFDRGSKQNSRPQPINETTPPKDAAYNDGALYAVLDPSKTGFDRRTNHGNKPIHVPNEYLELDPSESRYNRKSKTTLQHPDKETMFQLSDVYELAKPTTGLSEDNNAEETNYACSNVKVNNDFSPNTDNIYAHTVDDVYDVSSHVRQTNDRDSSYGQFVS